MWNQLPCLVKLLLPNLFIIYSLVESSHGGSYPGDEGMKPLSKQHQFFGKLNFPVTKETEAWMEKVRVFVD